MNFFESKRVYGMNDGCGKDKGFLPAGLAERFAQMLPVRKAALALDDYIRNGNTADTVAALQGCGLSTEVIGRMLQEVGREGQHG